MAYDLSNLLSDALNWLEQAIAQGRLPSTARDELQALTEARAQGLFSPDKTGIAPLLVAFVGGTGVGKSSLLNRLAGQAIAKTGVERPTSREVTLFHHHALSLQHLPANAPLSSVRLAQHHDSNNQSVVWIDMPDFDSIESANHQLVLDWLPYIDVLIYVVSPERYRDAKVWQLFLAEGAKHAWLFVMNHWDRGFPAQFDDFARQLQQAGFQQPLTFKTSCIETADDQFTELLQQLQQLGGQQLAQQIQQHHLQQQQKALIALLQTFQRQLQSQNHAELLRDMTNRLEHNLQSLLLSLDWEIRRLAQVWAQNLGQQNDFSIWDAMVQTRFDDQMNECLQLANQYHVPVPGLNNALQRLKQEAGKRVQQHAYQAGRLAMLQPGNGLQRGVILTLKILETLLPVSAFAIVGYQVFVGYYQSAAEHIAYLGGDFAIHSVLLIGLSWSIPFFLHKKLQPSLEKAAVRGLERGAQIQIRNLYSEVINEIQNDQQQTLHALKLLNELISRAETASLSQKVDSTLLARTLIQS